MTGVFAEIIGRKAPPQIAGWGAWSVAYDTTRPDYAWWDAMRRGEKAGYELASVFTRPATHVRAVWTLGRGFRARIAEGDEYTNDVLRRWTRSISSTLMTLLKDLDALGDQYVVVNADGSLSVPSPDTVQMVYNPVDYRQALGCIITTRFEDATITDEYTQELRRVRVKSHKSTVLQTPFGEVAPMGELVVEYDNLIGRLPVVHFANERGVNETNGRSLFQGLRMTLSQYDTILRKALYGVEVMGNPIPTWQGMENLEETWEINSVPTGEYDDNGQEIREVRFDQLTGLFLGKGGEFKFSAPANGFTQDVRDMLKLLFLLVLEYLQIPETVWGGEMGQARATSVEQMNSFYQSIEGRRLELEGVGSDSVLGVEAHGGLLALVEIWLRTRALTDRRVRVGDVVIEWDELRHEDSALQLDKVKWAHGVGIVRDETALRALALVDDVAGEIEAARTEDEASRDEFDAAMRRDAAA